MEFAPSLWRQEHTKALWLASSVMKQKTLALDPSKPSLYSEREKQECLLPASPECWGAGIQTFPAQRSWGNLLLLTGRKQEVSTVGSSWAELHGGIPGQPSEGILSSHNAMASTHRMVFKFCAPWTPIQFYSSWHDLLLTQEPHMGDIALESSS